MKQSLFLNYVKWAFLACSRVRVVNCCMIVRALSFLFVMIAVSGCSTEQFFYCTVSGYGSTPSAKSFYITPMDTVPYETLEYEEYSQELMRRLEDCGYLSTTPDSADICIYFDYMVGPKEVVGQSTTTRTSSVSFTNGNQYAKTNGSGIISSQTKLNSGTLKTGVNANAKSAQRVYGNQLTSSFGSVTTGNTLLYARDVRCFIRAVDVKSKKDIWLVEIDDVLKGSNSLRRVIPWLLTSAQGYFGKSGESIVKITRKDGERNRGLVWPY